MKTPLLLTILAVSLALNAWLFQRRAAAANSTIASTASAAAAVTPAKLGAPSAAAASAEKPVVWSAPAMSTDRLRAFAAELRAAGFPPRVIATFISTLLRDENQAQFADVPFWKLGQPDPALRKRQLAASDELQRRLEEVLGVDGTPAALMNPAQRAQRYGSLSDAKVNALLRIERDYQELSLDLNSFTGTMTREEAEARSAQRATIEKERFADIAAALSPDEFAAWELRNSGAAFRVQSAARNLAMTEDEYRAVVAAQKEFEPNLGNNFVSSIFSGDPRIADRLAMHEKVRATLGDERFDNYLRNYDSNYANIAAFAEKQGNVTKAQTQSLYQLQLESQASLAATQSRAGGTGERASPQETQKTWAELNQRLDTLLGAEAAEAFRNTPGGSFFKMFRAAAAPKPAPPRKN